MKVFIKRLLATFILIATVFPLYSCVITQNFDAYPSDIIVICDKAASCYTTIRKEEELNEITDIIFSKDYKVIRRAIEEEPYIYHIEFRKDGETNHPFILLVSDSEIWYDGWIYSPHGENLNLRLDYFAALIERSPIPK